MTTRRALCVAFQSLVFPTLMLSLQALLEPPEAQAADTAGLQLALAAAFAVYCFREKKRLSLGERAPCMSSQHGKLAFNHIVHVYVFATWLQFCSTLNRGAHEIACFVGTSHPMDVSAAPLQDWCSTACFKAHLFFFDMQAGPWVLQQAVLWQGLCLAPSSMLGFEWTSCR